VQPVPHVDANASSTLVTGGAGYIGSHTVRALRNAGRRVVVLDTLEKGSSRAVLDAPLVVGDIADETLVEQLCNEHAVDTIVHFAAYKSVGESMKNPARYVHNNIEATSRLLDASARAGVRHIVFSSSCSVYGTPQVVPVDESQPIQPESVYADTKAIAERLLQWFEIGNGVRSVSLRYCNAAGASFDASLGEDWTEAANLIPVAIKAALTDGAPLQVFGDDYPTADGTCIRDYIHVDDLARAHVAAVDYLVNGGPTTAINVGTGVGSSVMEVLKGLEHALGRPVPFVVVPRRIGDPVASWADPTRARELLGFEAEYGLTEILETAVRWHQAQLDAARN
jgi:UDP-glucose-4-epimerase GalE